MNLNNNISDVEKKRKRQKKSKYLLLFLILFALITSGYYLYNTLIQGSFYKIYVSGLGGNGTNVTEGLGLSYDPTYGHGYTSLSGKGIMTESKSLKGMSFATETLIDDNGKVYSNALHYLMSVASNDENGVDTNVTNQGQIGEANNKDQFLSSKFYLMNMQEEDKLNGNDGIINYAIRLTITSNTNNALAACRFALIEVSNEETIYNYDEGTFNNEAFKMMIIAQPKIQLQPNGDYLINKGDEPDSQEYVCSTVTGQYTNDPNVNLLKNPNKGKENEDWKCENLHYDDETKSWYYDTKKHGNEDNQVFSINPKENKAYVVAAWYEASDPDHNNSIMSGYVSFSFTFYAIE